MRFLILAKRTEYLRLEIEADSVQSAHRTVQKLNPDKVQWRMDHKTLVVENIQSLGEEE